MSEDVVYSSGVFEKDGSVRTVDLDVVDMSSRNWVDRESKWDSKGREVLEGIVDGFNLLYDEVSELDGFRVRYYDVDYVFRGENSWRDLSEVLRNHGFDKSRQYHVIYDGSLFPSKTGSYHWARTDDGTMWHDSDVNGISGVSLSTTRASLASAYIRGFHQLMHNYINSDIAIEYGTTENGYNAIHQLGCGSSSGRTLMADTHPHRAIRGQCVRPILGCLRAPKSIHFSDCTINAVKRSILRNE